MPSVAIFWYNQNQGNHEYVLENKPRLSSTLTRGGSNRCRWSFVHAAGTLHFLGSNSRAKWLSEFRCATHWPTAVGSRCCLQQSLPQCCRGKLVAYRHNL